MVGILVAVWPTLKLFEHVIERHAFYECGYKVALGRAERVCLEQIDGHSCGSRFSVGRGMQVGGEFALRKEAGGMLFKQAALHHRGVKLRKLLIRNQRKRLLRRD